MRQLNAVEKWSYAIGNMPFAVKDAAFVNFIIFYYTQVQGLSGMLAGLAAFIALTWDAFTDPVVGSWSDSVRSRWGRRHPLILLGGIPFALMFIPLFSPPDELSQSALFLWLTGTAIVLRTFLTIYFIPYSAMGAELSTDYDERTIIAKARVTMAWIAGMALPAIAFTFFFQSSSESDGRLIASNYDNYGLFSAGLATVALLVCVWGTRTTIDRLPKASATETGFTLGKTLADFSVALQNQNFRRYMGTHLAFGMAAGVYTTLSLYMGTYFWEFSSEQLAGLVVPTALGTLLAFTLVGRLGRRIDKPALLAVACIAIAVNTLWLTGARLLDWIPENGHPLIYPLQWVAVIFAVLAVAAVQMLGISLVADILDEQELETELRQEGVFFAASTFMQKATTAFGTLAAGFVIEVAGIEAGSQPGEVSERSLEILGWFMIAIIGLLSCIACWFSLRIELSRDEHARIRQALEQRGAQYEKTI